MAKAYIYGLYSSGNPDEIRYIGVSTDPQRRLYGHKSVRTSEKKFQSNPHKGRWIRNLYAEGHTLEYKILAEFASESEAYNSESLFMKQYGSMATLTNIAPGGHGGMHMSVDELKSALAKARTTNDYISKAIAAKQTPEYRELARERANRQWESPEARELMSIRSREMWAKRTPEERIPWNKGLRTSDAPQYVKTGYRSGSQELREHQAVKTREYYAKLKDDPEREAKFREAHKNKGPKISEKQKDRWANLPPEDRRLRGMKMSLGKKYSKAKKNNWVLELTPISCPRCGE